MSFKDTIETRRFTAANNAEWDEFLSKAKNATFLFQRGYMDYHADRFKDHSLMIYSKGKLSALLVANESLNTIHSHGGLTYGGMILEREARLEEVLQYFYHAVRYYSSSFSTILYKCVPLYLTQLASNEDLYALFLLEATLVRRDTSIVFDRARPLPNEKKTSARSANYNHSIVTSNSPDNFWTQILTPALNDRFGVAPVHTIDEMKLLMSRFPENIALYEANNNELLGGAVVYIMPNAVHLQYISSNEKGRELGVPDALIHHLMDVYNDKQYFSFGTSNSDNGKTLNRGLAAWKERFGARTYVHDFYEIRTDRYSRLQEYA